MPARSQVQLRRLTLLLVAVLAAIVWLNRVAEEGARGPGGSSSAAGPDLGPCRVASVIDGDTLRVDCAGRRERIRLLRIDTPERDQPGYEEAREALAEMVAGESVRLVFEEPGKPLRDDHGRLLAYVFLDELNVNVEMVRQGWSRFWTRYGEGRFAEAFEEAEREARRDGRGLWAAGTR